MSRGVRISRLNDRGDERGSSFGLARASSEFELNVRDIHVMTVLPGHVRGNHFHTEKTEVLIVYHRDRWTVNWDTGLDTLVQRSEVEGVGVVVVEIPPGCSHTIRNDGLYDLVVVGLSSHVYDSRHPDVVRRDLM
ncbi:MAG: hypothetical protein M3436_18870 [Pseudomonadota bacterium]|nr:hypothetical protein [Pseudomonadota bacterium]